MRQFFRYQETLASIPLIGMRLYAFVSQQQKSNHKAFYENTFLMDVAVKSQKLSH